MRYNNSYTKLSYKPIVSYVIKQIFSYNLTCQAILTRNFLNFINI